MAKDKSFLGNLFSRFSNSDNLEIKALQDRLDMVVGEAFDRDTYDAKFIEAEASTFGNNFMANFAGIDQIVDTAALQRVYASETWVYSAVNAISDTISALPLQLEKRKEYSRLGFNELTGKEETTIHETWEAANGERLGRLFQHPNPYSTKSEFINLLVIDLLTAGDYFIYLDSDQDLSAIADAATVDSDDENSPFSRLRRVMSTNIHIKGMYRIPPSMIKPVREPGRNNIVGYALQSDKGAVAFSPAEIIHVRLPNPNDQMMGLSPMIPAFKSILLDRFTTEHMIRFYKSGARLGGIIQTDKALNKEQISRLQRTFESNFTGRQNHHRTLILPPGMEYKLVEQNPAETALLEFCRYNREAILAVYRVPPIKLGIMENANYANARVQLKLFFTQTVKKYLDFIQEGFNNHPAMLLDNRTYRVQFDLSNVEELQEDLKEKGLAATSMLSSGATVNEVREAVWKKGPIDGGSQSPVVVQMETSQRGAQPAPAAPELGKSQESVPTLLDSKQIGSILSIIKEITNGNITRASAVEMLVASFGMNRDAADLIIGDNQYKEETPPSNSMDNSVSVAAKVALPDVQADTALLSDITPTTGTLSQRAAQLVEAFVQGGVPLSIAVPKAIEQAKLEGFSDNVEPPVEDKDLGINPGEQGAAFVPVAIGTQCPKCNKPMEDCTCGGSKDSLKPSLAEYLAAEISKLDDSSEITGEIIDSIKQRYKETYDGMVAVKEVVYANGYTKDSVTAHWKTFISKTDPLVEARQAELKKFFSKYKSIVMNRFGANLKSYGMYKSRDSEDAEAILDDSAYKNLIDQYIAEIDNTLTKAMQQGYADTLVDFNFGPATDEAKKALREYALMSAKSVDATTRDQLKSMLVKMFEDGKSVTEIGEAIADKFSEIDMGRAMTIARTETLTAVSLGKAAKRTEWQTRFPDKKLKKMWLTAKDNRVRDTHEVLEGETVESDAQFSNGLMYPRDPSGEASEVINCRCDVIDYAEDDQAIIEQDLDSNQDEQSNE